MQTPLGAPSTLSCDACVQDEVMAPHAVATLQARDYNMRRVADLARDEIGAHKPLEPSDWFHRVLASVRTEGVLEPILVSRGPDGLELIDGHHRAWASAHYQLHTPARIFTPACGACTEESFAADAMARTAELGWKY